MDVKQFEEDVREGRVKLDRLVELLITQQRKLTEAQDRIRTLEATVDELQQKLAASTRGKFTEPFSLKAEEKRQEARGRKGKRKKNKPRRQGRLRTADKLALGEMRGEPEFSCPRGRHRPRLGYGHERMPTGRRCRRGRGRAGFEHVRPPR